MDTLCVHTVRRTLLLLLLGYGHNLDDLDIGRAIVVTMHGESRVETIHLNLVVGDLHGPKVKAVSARNSLHTDSRNVARPIASNLETERTHFVLGRLRLLRLLDGVSLPSSPLATCIG